MQSLKKQNELVNQELEAEKQRRYRQEMLSTVGGGSSLTSGYGSSPTPSDSESQLSAISQKLAMLEIKELNERQKGKIFYSKYLKLKFFCGFELIFVFILK